MDSLSVVKLVQLPVYQPAANSSTRMSYIRQLAKLSNQPPALMSPHNRDSSPPRFDLTRTPSPTQERPAIAVRVPDEFVSLVVGEGGSVIKSIQRAAGCLVQQRHNLFYVRGERP